MPGRGWIAAVLATSCALAAPAWAVPTSFTVSGAVGAPGTYDAAALGALPQSTQAVTYRAGTGSVSDSFTGPTLWNVLQAASQSIRASRTTFSASM